MNMFLLAGAIWLYRSVGAPDQLHQGNVADTGSTPESGNLGDVGRHINMEPPPPPKIKQKLLASRSLNPPEKGNAFGSPPLRRLVYFV